MRHFLPAMLALLGGAAAQAEEVDLKIDFARTMMSDDLRPVVTIMLDDHATAQLAQFTTPRVGSQIFVYVAGKLVTVQTLNAPIVLGFVELSGEMDMKTADSIARYVDRVGAMTVADSRR